MLPDARRQLLLTCAGAAAVVILTVCAYWPSLGGEFIWDDDYYVTNNTLLKAPDGLWTIWLSPRDAPSQYFPLVYTTFRFEYGIWALDPRGYKIVNLILHIGNALLVWQLLRMLRAPGAWLAACVFAIHPMQVESVAWITERKNVLSTLFYLLCVIAWLGFLKNDDDPVRRYLICFVLFVLALFAKTTACTVPAALVLILWLRRERIGWRRLLQLAPFVIWGIVMGGISVWLEHVKQGTRGSEFSLPLIDRLLVASRAVWFYLGKLVWPTRLTFSYPKWNIDARDPLQYLWVVAVVLSAWLLWRYRQRRRPVTAAIVFFVAALSPMLGFFSLFTFLYTYVADHYAYLAIVGPIAIGTAILWRNWNSRPANVLAHFLAPTILIGILSALTWQRAAVYKSAKSIWTDVLEKNPASWMAHNNLAAILTNEKDYVGARAHLENALALRPRHAEARLNLGRIEEEQNNLDAAIACYRKSAEIRPDYDASYYNLGRALAKKGDSAGAIAAYTRALEINPQYTWARTNLGVLLFDQGRYDDAIAQYQIVLGQDPRSISARTNLGKAYAQQKKIPEAIAQWNIVMREDPTNANVAYGLGILYGQIGRIDDAIRVLQIAVQRNPNLVEARQLLELALRERRGGATMPAN